MRIDWWTLGLQAINVAVLVWLLAHFLFRPVARIVAERQQATQALIDGATAAKDAASAERRRAAEETEKLVQQRGQLLDAATAEAAGLRATLEAAARIDIDRLHEQAKEQIDTARREASASDADRATRFALDIAAKLLQRLPRPARVTSFIDGLAAGVRQLPGTTRAQLAGDAGPVRLLVPDMLTGEELAACRAALTRELGQEPAIEVVVEPALIAGLELESSHAVVRNSFRDDLAHLSTELLSHDTDQR